MPNKTLKCPECGAKFINGLDCWEQLGHVLAWEWHDPELLAKHFLTVATYNLQHPAQFTEEAIEGLKEVYLAYLDEGMAIDEVRRHVGKAAAGGAKVLKPTSERQPQLKRWTKTINTVYIPDKPKGAAERVQAWAEAVRVEL